MEGTLKNLRLPRVFVETHTADHFRVKEGLEESIEGLPSHFVSSDAGISCLGHVRGAPCSPERGPHGIYHRLGNPLVQEEAAQGEVSLK